MERKMRVEVGSGGSPMPGYIHCDLCASPHVELVCTASAIPFKHESIDEIYARHVLEHLTLQEAKLALMNWRGALRSGGRVDINVPDLKKTIRQLGKRGYSPYLNARVSNRDHAMGSIYGWQNNDRDLHKWGYTHESLSQILREAGFVHIKRIRDDSESGPVNLRVVAEKGMPHAGGKELESDGLKRGRPIRWLLRVLLRRAKAV